MAKEEEEEEAQLREELVKVWSASPAAPLCSNVKNEKCSSSSPLLPTFKCNLVNFKWARGRHQLGPLSATWADRSSSPHSYVSRVNDATEWVNRVVDTVCIAGFNFFFFKLKRTGEDEVAAITERQRRTHIHLLKMEILASPKWRPAARAAGGVRVENRGWTLTRAAAPPPLFLP